MIIDDEPMILRVLRRFLIHNGYVTYEAGSATEALRLFREEQPFHAVLCDVYLGIDNGWKLMKQIYPVQSSMRIVILSGSVIHDPPPVKYPYTLLLKPFTQEELREALGDIE